MCEEMFAEAARFGEEAIAAEAAVDGAEAGDCAGSAADDVERYRGDLVTELAVDEAQRVAFELAIVEELRAIEQRERHSDPAGVERVAHLGRQIVGARKRLRDRAARS